MLYFMKFQNGKFEDVINGLHSEFGYGNCGNALEAGLKNSSLYLNNDGVYNEKYKVDASNKSKDNDKFEYEFDIKKWIMLFVKFVGIQVKMLM